MQTNLGRDPAPSAIRYLVLTSAFTSLLMAVSFIPVVLGSNTLSTDEMGFYQSAIPAFILMSVFTFVEWFLLRRSRKMTGPYGFAMGLEILKSLSFNIGAIQYAENVPGASSSSFFLLQVTSYGILVSLVITKVARTRIDQIAQHDISKHALNLLPTLLVLALFLGTYVTEITGLGTPRQSNTFSDYEEKDIDWSMFNTPTWDATYLLENLLDQFTAGLSAPDTPLFYVTSGQNPNPFAYWRLGSLELYEYTGKAPYSTDWNPADSTKRVLTPYQTGTPYSEELPEPLRTAQFTVRVPIDYEDSIAEITIHPNFANYLPVTWNGRYGSYIDSASFVLKTDEMSTTPFTGSDISTSTKETREIFPNAFANDLLGVDANIRVSQTSNNSGTLQYTVDYQFPQYSSAATFSLNRTDADYLQCVNSATWSAIKSLYLQLPNDTGQLPSPCYVGGDSNVQNGNNEYSTWAPFVTGNASAWNQPDQDVFGQAFANMMAFQQLGVDFDEEMWVSNQLVPNMDHPEEYEDYNEWFFRRDPNALKGVSLHFASAFSTICRLQGIPSRVVIGYANGNDTFFPWNMISSRWLHAWSEVLVPVQAYYDPITSDFVPNHVEWVPFDPLVPIPSTFIRGDYDLESNGFAQAYLEEQLDPGSILRRCVVNNSAFGDGATITNNTRINISVRLISVIPPDLWIPIQNQQVAFYVGTDAENTTGNIWETGTWIGNVSTNSRGIATLNMTVNVFQLGIRPVKFWTVTTYAGQIKLASSFTYNLSLF